MFLRFFLRFWLRKVKMKLDELALWRRTTRCSVLQEAVMRAAKQRYKERTTER